MNALLQITADHYGQNIMESKGFLETLGFGGMMLGIGMLTVFAVLILLWCALIIFKLVFHDLPAKKSGTVTPVAPAPVVTAAAPAAAVKEDELIAVIAAAIAMAESESNGAKFRVVSFKRK